jgi:hypothetical protein
VIYSRLSQIPELSTQLLSWLHQPLIIFVLVASFFLMPINWGIESYKWKLITQQVESIPFITALKSVFMGICLGNIAPGRAMEFLGKIYFFKSENKPSVTILHFINGMFQMLITVLVGISAIAYKFQLVHSSAQLVYSIIVFGIVLIIFFCLAILNVSTIQRKLKFIKWFKFSDSTQQLSFSKMLLLKLVVLSMLRYFVFSFQFYLVYRVLSLPMPVMQMASSIAVYFMLTSLIPMISFIEPAIRAAIALFVFNQVNDSYISVVLSATLLWFINVVLPSIIGYLIILKAKINFNIKNGI